MAVKVLVTQIGQQLIADVKQIENQDTKVIVGYWLKQPRTINYTQNEDGGLGVNFGPYCPISDEAEFSIRAEHIVAILEPRQDVLDGYNTSVYPSAQGLESIPEGDTPVPGTNTTEPPVTDAPPVTDDGTIDTGTDTPEDGTNAGLTD